MKFLAMTRKNNLQQYAAHYHHVFKKNALVITLVEMFLKHRSHKRLRKNTESVSNVIGAAILHAMIIIYEIRSLAEFQNIKCKTTFLGRLVHMFRESIKYTAQIF